MNYSGFLRFKNQSGQALLIVVLVMVVALTVTLSLVSRSIINIKTSTDQANSQKALSAAEAGIEQAVKLITSGSNETSIAGNFTGNNTTYSTTITPVSGSSGFLVNGGNLLLKDDGANVWLTPYSTTSPWQSPWSGTLRVHWGDGSGACNNAAIEVAIILGPSNTPSSKRAVFDPCPARTSVNHFAAATASDTSVGGKNFTYYADIPITNGLLMRAIPLYKSSYAAVTGSALPDQGKLITSTGKLETTERKVTLFQGYPELPAELFPYSLLSL